MGDIARRDIIDLIDDIMDAGTPVAANRCLAAIKTFFNWCVERGDLETSPAAAVKRRTKEHERKRVLSEGEVQRLWPAWETMAFPFGRLHQLLLATGQRRNEVAMMRWSEIDLESRVWHIPGERTKNGDPHDVPLSKLAMEILQGLPRFTSGDYVFTTTGGARPVSGYSRSKRRADELSGVTGWTLHDLRRTAASGMTKLKVQVATVARVLNHSPRAVAGITAVYDRYGYEQEKRDALEAWAQRLESLIRRTPEKVVALHAER